MKRFNKLNAIWTLILLSIFGAVDAQNSISLEKALAITIKENIDIKIKTTELDQVKNYENDLIRLSTIKFLGVILI